MSGKGQRIIANAANNKSPEQVKVLRVKGTKQDERCGKSPGFAVALSPVSVPPESAIKLHF